MKFRYLISFVLGAVVLGVAGLHAASTPEANAALYGEATVVITDEGVDPAVVPLWQTWYVHWQNDSSITQRIVSDDDAPVAFDTGDIAPGETATVQFMIAGQYRYHSTTDGTVAGVILVEQDAPDRGRIEVTKEIDFGGGGSFPVSFTICVTGPSYPTTAAEGSCQTATEDGEVLIWHNVLIGEYEVTEQSPDSPAAGITWETTIQGSPLTVVDDEIAEATVSNAIRGSIKVNKVVHPAFGVPDLGDYVVCITGPSHPAPGSCQAVRAGGSVSWSGLIFGSYVVTEQLPPSAPAGMTVDIAPSTVVVNAFGTSEATVTNRFPLGKIKIIKHVDWKHAHPVASTVFKVCIAGPSYPTPPGLCHEFKQSDHGTYPTWEATHTFHDLVPGTYNVTEVGLSPSVWKVEIKPAAIFTVEGNKQYDVHVYNTNLTPKTPAPKPPNTGTAAPVGDSGTPWEQTFLAAGLVFVVSVTTITLAKRANR